MKLSFSILPVFLLFASGVQAARSLRGARSILEHNEDDFSSKGVKQLIPFQMGQRIGNGVDVMNGRATYSTFDFDLDRFDNFRPTNRIPFSKQFC